MGTMVEFGAARMPPPTLPPAPPLILGAGWGSSGTRAMAMAMVHFGLTTGHCSHYVNVSARVHCGLSLCGHGLALLQQRLCAYLAEGSQDPSAFRVFDGLDAIFDTPAPNFFPYLWRAYGATARVILTSRTPSAWYASRSQHHYADNCLDSDHFLQNRSARPRDGRRLKDKDCSQWIDELPGEGSHPTVPGSWRAGKDEPLSAARRCNVSGVAPGAEPRVDAGTLQRAYSAHNALVRSLVPSSRLLDIDITAISAEEAWARVARFLRRKIPEDACLAPDCRFPELRPRGQKLPAVNLTNDFDGRCRFSKEFTDFLAAAAPSPSPPPLPTLNCTPGRWVGQCR